MAQEFKDTRPTNEPNTTVDYQDPTDVDEVQDEIKNGVIDPISQTFALWIRTKMYRRHVRESLARMMEYTSVLFNKIKAISENTEKRQSKTDSEVIDARSSERLGNFKTLDERLEYFENIIASVIPVGFDVTIVHNLGAQPVVNVRTWTHGIGVLPLGTEPTGLFGGSASQSIQSTVRHVNSSECIVSIPLDYTTEFLPVKINEYKYLLIDEKNSRSIVFDLII